MRGTPGNPCRNARIHCHAPRHRLDRIEDSGPGHDAPFRDVDALKTTDDLTDGFLLSVLGSSPDWIKIVEPDGTILFTNDAGPRFLQTDDTSPLVGAAWADLWPEESRDLARRAFQDAAGGANGRFETCWPTKMGDRWLDVTVSPIRSPAGKVSHVLSVARDVTDIIERKGVQKAKPQPESLSEPRSETGIDEEKRLAALMETDLLDSIDDERFDNLTKLASEVLGVPTALVSLVDRDRQWFKSRHNFTDRETPRNVSFCSQAIEHPDEIMIVEDARHDNRVCDNPLVLGNPGIGFYAGVPLITDSGFPIGTLCIIDYKPRTLTAREARVLRTIAETVMTEIALIAKERERSDLDIINLEMRHRMGNAYARVSSLVSLIGRSENDKDQFIAKLQSSIGALARLQADIALNEWQSVGVMDLVLRALDMTAQDIAASAFELSLDETLQISSQGAFMLTLAIQELVSNAAKYGALSGADGRVHISVGMTDAGFEFLWEEEGGSVVASDGDARSGFGGKLLTQIVPQALTGTATHDVTPGRGCRYRLNASSAIFPS